MEKLVLINENLNDDIVIYSTTKYILVIMLKK